MSKAYSEYMRLWSMFPGWMHGLQGLVNTGARGEQPKGIFHTGEQTRYGYSEIAEEMRRRIEEHGYDPDSGLETWDWPHHMTVYRYITGAQKYGLRLSDEDLDYLTAYRDTYGETFVQEVDKLLERTEKYYGDTED